MKFKLERETQPKFLGDCFDTWVTVDPKTPTQKLADWSHHTDDKGQLWVNVGLAANRLLALRRDISD